MMTQHFENRPDYYAVTVVQHRAHIRAVVHTEERDELGQAWDFPSAAAARAAITALRKEPPPKLIPTMDHIRLHLGWALDRGAA